MKLFARQRSLVVVRREAPRSSFVAPRSTTKRRTLVANSAAPSPSSSSSDLDAPPPPPLRLPGADEDPAAHARNAAAIARYVRRFLDEEWRLELEDHGRLGAAAAAAYRRVVAEASVSAASVAAPTDPPGRLDVGDVLLAVASDLSARPELFAETFTDAFETANKVAELLVHGLSGGKTECGCVSESSVELMDEAFEFAEKEGEETG